MKNWMSIAAFGISVLTLTSCSKQAPHERESIEHIDESTLSLSDEVIHNLTFLKTSLADFPEQLPLTGKIGVTEDRTTVVPARVGGRIESVYFASGEFVKKGQILATLFSPDYIGAREEYVQSLKQANIAAQDGVTNDFLNLAEMTRKKLDTMGLSHKDIDDIPRSIASQANLPIRAPRDGFLITKTATLGNLVNVGDTLFTIADLSKVWFAGDLYPEDLPKAKKNQEVVIRSISGGQPILGHVSFISPVVDTSTRTIKIRALMDNPENLLRADMYVQGSLVLKRKQAILLPNEAIVRTPNGHIVFKQLDPPSIEGGGRHIKVKKVEIQLGSERQGFTEITSGILEGESVVTDGALLLYAALNSNSK